MSFAIGRMEKVCHDHVLIAVNILGFKKKISDHLRKQVISVVSQDPFQWAKKQLPRTYIICLYLLSFVIKCSRLPCGQFSKVSSKWPYFI